MTRLADCDVAHKGSAPTHEAHSFRTLKIAVLIPVIAWIGGVIYALATGR